MNPTAAASAFDLPTAPMVSQAFSPTDRSLPLSGSGGGGSGSGSGAASARRPPSLSSRSTHTRRHRSHRSHHGGGGSYLPQNEFPVFAHTGDVEIVVAAEGQERRYVLHRLILAQCSGFFEASTSEQWSRAQAQQASSPGSESGNGSGLGVIGEEGGSGAGGGPLGGFAARNGSVTSLAPGQRLMWRYELDTGSGEQDEDIPMLVQKPVTQSLFGGDSAPIPPPVRNKPPAPTNGFFRSISAMQSAIHIPSSVTGGHHHHHRHQQPAAQPDPDLVRDYDNLFRIFYNHPPALDAVDITEAYIQCKTLLTLADLYDALEVVGPRIDHHLLQFQSRLWKQIAKYPPSYLKLGYLARSRVIFAEALVHVVGQWPLGAPQLRAAPPAIRELVEDKAADLDDLRARVEGRLFRLGLTTARGERVAPHSAPLDWQAVSLFRHWLAENLAPPGPPLPLPPKPAPATGSGHGPGPARPSAPPPGSSPSSGGGPQAGLHTAAPPVGRAFRQLGAGGAAYLGRDELKRFLKLRPDEYSRDALRRFERRVDDLKALARDVVRPLVRSSLELEGTGHLGYLTCTKVEEADYPW